MPTTITKDELRIARDASRRRLSTLFWLDREDLAQEALLAMEAARRTHDPERGPWALYAWGAARNGAGELYHRARGAATPPRGMPAAGRAGEDHPALRDLQEPLGPEERLLRARLAAEVRARALRVMAGVLGRAERLAAEAVLLGGERPRHVAAAAGVPRRAVYDAAARAREALRRDPKLLELWKELIGE